jgi:hypothetical protein
MWGQPQATGLTVVDCCYPTTFRPFATIGFNVWANSTHIRRSLPWVWADFAFFGLNTFTRYTRLSIGDSELKLDSAPIILKRAIIGNG